MGRKTKIQSFQDIIVWQKANALASLVYQLSKGFPKEEKYALTGQMRRAAISVTSNFVEGFSRKSKKERQHFYNISRGSLEELKSQIFIAHTAEYLSNEDVNLLYERADEVGKLLYKWARMDLAYTANTDN